MGSVRNGVERSTLTTERVRNGPERQLVGARLVTAPRAVFWSGHGKHALISMAFQNENQRFACHRSSSQINFDHFSKSNAILEHIN